MDGREQCPSDYGKKNIKAAKTKAKKKKDEKKAS